MIIPSVNLSAHPLWITRERWRHKARGAGGGHWATWSSQPCCWPGCPEPWVSGGRAKPLNTYRLSITCHTATFVKQGNLHYPDSRDMNQVSGDGQAFKLNFVQAKSFFRGCWVYNHLLSSAFTQIYKPKIGRKWQLFEASGLQSIWRSQRGEPVVFHYLHTCGVVRSLGWGERREFDFMFLRRLIYYFTILY